ncbi:hypothetical protein BSPCLSOX_614 [uncultured Gammaproteobacteria bacterium]|nr:hypothetical protein BSPCLSOX_1988 [uncultured Gammaproteobacteria bacterium]VVH58116.1 hypothetical protein BSPCLSOX_614 [uncultured Gammaproteobacteria bacterium]
MVEKMGGFGLFGVVFKGRLFMQRSLNKDNFNTSSFYSC